MESADVAEGREATLSALSRWCWRLTFATIAVGFVATMVFSWGTLGRPLTDSAEGEVLFEAARIRGGLSLYVDPLVGAFDYGPVPARYFVLYPPIMPWLVSLVPFAASPPALRALGTLGWLGLFASIAWRAEPGCRRAAWTGAALVASVFALAPFVSSGRPDTLAALLAGLGLARSARLGRVDPLAAALFAVAPWIKPNIVGLAAGAMLVDLALRRTRALASIAVALVVSVALYAVLMHVSHGAFLTHLRMSTGQPLSLVQWKAQLPGRLQFFGVPAVLAALCGWRARGDGALPERRRDGIALALGALVVAAAWALLSAAKIGSSACYWMETCIASVVVLAHAPLPRPALRASLVCAVAALVQALWIDVASVRSTFEATLEDVPDQERVIGRARAVCRAKGPEVVVADDVGTELALNGRITAQPFQMTHLVRAGLYPASVWISDVERPEVVGVVLRNDLLERPLGTVSVEYDRFGPELRRVLAARFRLADESGSWRTYCARPASG